MSRLEEKFMLASMAILVAASAGAETWRTYHNTRFGTTAEVPASWKMGPPPENNDGRAFSSPDGRAAIIISGIFSVLSDKEEVAIHLGPGEGETITYKKQGSNWIVVSGIKGHKIFYRKSILSCRDTIWNDVSIEYYPAAEKEKYDPLVAHVAASLREGRGYDWVTKCD
jgi:hypothetical protein